jgi:RNA polymerase sigma-70 factor (ECF subfamily)
MLEAEQELIEKAQNGDSASFGRLYDHYIKQIYRFIAVKVGTRQEAEDLAHEVFMSAWQKLPNFKSQGFPFSSWLYKIARNRVIDHYRTKKPNVSIDEDVTLSESLFITDDTAGEELDLNLSLSRIKEAMLELTPEQREVVTMRFVEDLSPQEIAQVLDKREGTVRIIQHRAITKLKKILWKNNS